MGDSKEIQQLSELVMEKALKMMKHSFESELITIPKDDEKSTIIIKESNSTILLLLLYLLDQEKEELAFPSFQERTSSEELDEILEKIAQLKKLNKQLYSEITNKMNQS